jgi:hypothetical protein
VTAVDGLDQPRGPSLLGGVIGRGRGGAGSGSVAGAWQRAQVIRQLRIGDLPRAARQIVLAGVERVLDVLHDGLRVSESVGDLRLGTEPLTLFGRTMTSAGTWLTPTPWVIRE